MTTTPDFPDPANEIPDNVHDPAEMDRSPDDFPENEDPDSDEVLNDDDVEYPVD